MTDSADVVRVGHLGHNRTEEAAERVVFLLDSADLEVYACGVNAMVSRLTGTARLLGDPDEHVQYEGDG